MNLFLTTRRERDHQATSIRRALRQAFSLIEVNMAILVVAGGLLTLFALFPAGLRLSTTALADMRQSMFANEMLSRMEANAASIQNLSDWTDPVAFWTACSKNTWADGATLTASDVNKVYTTEMIEIDDQPIFVLADGYMAPARFIIRIARLHPILPPSVPASAPPGLYRQVVNSRNVHLDGLTWKISMVVSDQPDVIFTHNPVYHTEVRYQARL